MRYVMIFFSLITMVYAESTWVLTKNSTPLSYYVEFNYLEREALVGKVERSGLFTPRYYYDLYSAEGTFLARAINRVLSLGLLDPSQMEFDIYDEMNDYVGYIGGKFWTNGQAKFIFCNAAGAETGSAFLSSDSDQAVFSFLSPANGIVATLKGALSGDLSTWVLDVKQPLDIDARSLKIFGAFISDFHDSFIRKPVINYYIYNSNNTSM